MFPSHDGGHVESGGFRVLTENLNYSAQALEHYISPNILGGQAERHTNTPDSFRKRLQTLSAPIADPWTTAIDPHPGDGWRSRGGGILQRQEDTTTRTSSKSSYENDSRRSS